MTKCFYTVLFFFISYQGSAQLCQGSLGDPIVNISFGAGNNTSSPLPAAATGYQYSYGDCPNDGSYTVRNNSITCFNNSWHTITADHTGDPNGYFMLINASIQPSAFYVDTVRGLCGNSTYEFAAWIMNVILPSSCDGNSTQPNLTFSIESTSGTVLKTYNSNNIPPTSSPTWNQYGFFFTSPGGGTVVIRIVNNAPGGCGNDLALDDITFRPCGPLLIPSIQGQAINTVNICEGDTKSFTFDCRVSGGFTNPAYQWQQRFDGGNWTDITGQNTTSLTRAYISTASKGTYEYRLAVAEAGNLGSAQCRISSGPVAVIINGLPVASATNNGPVCDKSALQLQGLGGATYSWSGPAGFVATGASPVISPAGPAQAGTYGVKVTSSAGCISNATTSVVINPAPVAFTGSSDLAICLRDTTQLSASGGNTYQWIPINGLSSATIPNPKASPVSTTTYMVVASNQFKCTDTATTVVTVFERAFANAGPDKFLIDGQTVSLSGSITGQYQSFNWSPLEYISNTQSLQPIVNPPGDATYILSVQSKNNCGVNTDTVQVKYYKGIFIPSAFTPNGDGINPTFYIPSLNAFPGFELRIFNRYGQLVFESRNANICWDGNFKGQQALAGAYTYIIDLKKPPGILKGTLLLIR